jgi:hypothetical protein
MERADDMKRMNEMMLTLGSLAGVATSGMAAMTIWLLLTQPLTVANAVTARDLTPLLQAIAGALVSALAAVVRYL